MVGTESRTLRPASLRTLLPQSRMVGGGDIQVTRLAPSPRGCLPGDLVVIDCSVDDPHLALAEALARGASGILCEQLQPCPLPQCIVPDALAATAMVADALAGQPTNDIFTVGVIGEAGKTTTALLVAATLRAAGIRTAYNTDLGSCDGIVQITPRQTADTPLLHSEWLSDSRDAGSATAVMELSDAMLSNHCLEPLHLDLLIVTGNPGRHADFGPHRLQQALDHLNPSGVVIVSSDAPQAVRMVDEAGAQKVTYGLRNDSDVTGKIFEQVPGETTLLVTAGDCTAVLETGLTGPAMASNQLAAIAVGLLSELDLPSALEALRAVKPIPGRMERVTGYDTASVVLDSANNSARLAATMRGLRRERQGGRLWCITTPSAHLSEDQLALLGRTAERFADHVIYTSGAAGKETFLQATHAMLDGVHNIAAPRLIADRKRAIEWAVTHAEPGDTILIAGGYQQNNPHEQRSTIDADRTCIEQARELDATSRETRPMTIPFPSVALN
ncbi:MurE-like ligase [Roseimaritima multifibrata]|uniref:MurE-like ligase n=2 Tax=Roseimaritima multifibrata TaxID=1930274 RepID=A0A517MLI4_9BACT|nr:MurE-like ligase [Roseimaritima multifibrata]